MIFFHPVHKNEVIELKPMKKNGNMTKDLIIPIKREQSKLVCSAEREEFGMKFNRNIYIIFAAPRENEQKNFVVCLLFRSICTIFR